MSAGLVWAMKIVNKKEDGLERRGDYGSWSEFEDNLIEGYIFKEYNRWKADNSIDEGLGVYILLKYLEGMTGYSW